MGSTKDSPTATYLSNSAISAEAGLSEHFDQVHLLVNLIDLGIFWFFYLFQLCILFFHVISHMGQ